MLLKQLGTLFSPGDAVLTNPRRPRITRLDDLPFPAYEKLFGFPQKYHLPLFSFIKRFGATMMTSRGCPHSCSFCDRTVFQHEYAYNSAEYVWEHMRHLRDDFGVHHINFYDDLFTANRQRILELCELLSSKPLGIDFNCSIRVGHANAELLKSLKRAGCIQISVGVETGDAELLSRHKLGVTIQGVRETTERAHAAGLRVKGLFVFGLPGETPKSAQTTSDFIQSIAFDEINISKFSPFHGAPIWSECVSGRSGKLQEDWRLMNCLHFTYLPRLSFHQRNGILVYPVHSAFLPRQTLQKLFRQRLWDHRWSLWHVISHLPRSFMQFPI
jgi:magnesium-protoporphyrin IX monomethyl ester (oxidative) cyclase